jgi:hypothetical protein
MAWFARVVSIMALGVVVWACGTSWGAVVHGNPAYAVLLLLTVAFAVWGLVKAGKPQPQRGPWRKAGRIAALVLAIGWVAAIAWLRPFTAVEPALAAMQSDAKVTVEESPTQIVMTPAGGADATALLFQPGAKVEARAYAAVLRPVAEAGHRVVIVKQPLSIAFLSLGALASARSAYPDVQRWVVGGHSLGGTVAAIEADDADDEPTGPAVGLLLYASYPASDMSTTLSARVLSVSASDDGLATPADIDASKADLPKTAEFVVIQGAVHAYLGDYGPQPGDGTPTISQEQARQEIVAATVPWVDGLGG